MFFVFARGGAGMTSVVFVVVVAGEGRGEWMREHRIKKYLTIAMSGSSAQQKSLSWLNWHLVYRYYTTKFIISRPQRYNDAGNEFRYFTK